MRRISGVPQIQLEIEDRTFLERLQTVTSKAYEFAVGHRRLFVRLGEWDNEKGDWGKSDQNTTIMPRSALLKNINAARKDLQKADEMLAEWQISIKEL